MLFVRQQQNLKTLIRIRHLSSSSSHSEHLFWHSEAKEQKNSNTSVLVLGWAGSKKAHVDKYSSLFSKTFGLNSFSCVSPMADFLSYDFDAQVHFCRQFLNAVLDRSHEGKTKLVIHSMSNNGFSVYQHIVHECTNNAMFSNKFVIAGAIFDSGPGPLSLPSFVGCRFNLGSNKFVQQMLTPTVSNEKRLFRPFCTIFYNYYIDRMDKSKSFAVCLQEAKMVAKRFDPNWKKFSNVWPWPGDYMLVERARWPLLFLYSDRDRMMPAAFVERVIEAQKAADSRRFIQAHNFRTSEHVSHFKDFPEDYKAQIKYFLTYINGT